MRKPVIALRDRGDCYVGEIDMPLRGGGRHRVSTLGWDPLDTLKKVASQAKAVITNPALAPLIPPQVTAAITTAQAIAKLSQSAPEVARKLAAQMSPAAKKLATSILSKPTKRPPARRGTQPKQQRPASVLVPGRSTRATVSVTKPPVSTMPTQQTAMPSPADLTFPFNPLDPNEAAAMQAWGAEAFAPQEGYVPPVEEFPDEEYDDGSEAEGQVVYQEDVWEDAES